jgi:galactose mutarotase-like enzyme
MGLSATSVQETCAAEVWKLRSNVAQADVYSVGGALHNLRFTLPDGRQVSPLAEADWQNAYLTKTGSGQARHLELLGGEWPCVPFGSSHLDPAHHGFGADHHWTFERQGENRLSLSITYPNGHAIKHLRRDIMLPMDENHVEIGLSVLANRDVVMPIGVHPIFKIPQTNAWSLAPGRHDKATTSAKPATVDGASVFPNHEICASGDVALRCGQSADLWRTPSVFTDALIQLWKTDGHFELHDRHEGTATWLDWNPNDLPHCLLWFANPGLSLDNASVGFRGLGVEPIHANFDGYEGTEISPAGVALTAGQPWQTTYRIGCRSL